MIIWNPQAPGGILDALSKTYWSPLSGLPPTPNSPYYVKAKPHKFDICQAPQKRVAKTNKKKRPPKPTKYQRRPLIFIAIKIDAYYSKNKKLGFTRPTLLDILAALRKNQINDDWMEEHLPSSYSYHTCYPTSTLRNPQPAYAYRDPLNLATQATYGEGTPYFSPAQYTGQLNGTHFEDTQLVWAKTIWDNLTPQIPNPDEFTLIRFQGQIDVNADIRASRPMFSLLFSVAHVNAYSNAYTIATPPIRLPGEPRIKGSQKYQHIYHKEPTPPGTVPYYHKAIQIDKLFDADQCSYNDAAGPATMTQITLCPRPMFGRSNNNNTTVETHTFIRGRIYHQRRLQPLFFGSNPNVYSTYPAYFTTDLAIHMPVSAPSLGGGSFTCGNAQGSLYGGYTTSGSITQPFLWRPSSGYQYFTLQSGNTRGDITHMSRDGSIIAGHEYGTAQSAYAFVMWDIFKVFFSQYTTLGNIKILSMSANGKTFVCVAYPLLYDISMIISFENDIYTENYDVNHPETYINAVSPEGTTFVGWTNALGYRSPAIIVDFATYISLPDLGADKLGEALCTDFFATTIGGYVSDGTKNLACFWDEFHVLHTITLSGTYVNARVTAISDDGKFIAGTRDQFAFIYDRTTNTSFEFGTYSKITAHG